ncbi:MAG: hypothetical protein ACRDSZ_04715 [Pseudonocardiaceae bacterium]
MSDAVSFAEIDEQQVELLPERTVMSTIFLAEGETAGDGGDGVGGIGGAVLSGIGILAEGNAITGSGIGGAGGAINPAPAH